jgi:hypothetical protein
MGKQRKGNLTKADTYNDAKFTDAHKQFKWTMNFVFRQLVEKYVFRAKGSIIFLDGPSALTSQGLEHFNLPMYIPNPHEDTLAELKKRTKATLFHGHLEDALTTVWKDVPFQAAYLDSTHANVEPLIRMFDSFFDRVFDVSLSIVFGYTILGRDRNQQSELKRVGEVQQYLNLKANDLNRKLVRARDLDAYLSINWLHNGTFTEFFVLEPKTNEHEIKFIEELQKVSVLMTTLTKEQTFIRDQTSSPRGSSIENESEDAPIADLRLKTNSDQRNKPGICSVCSQPATSRRGTVCSKKFCQKKKHNDENSKAMRKKRQCRETLRRPTQASTAWVEKEQKALDEELKHEGMKPKLFKVNLITRYMSSLA